MSAKTLVSGGVQYMDSKGALYGLTSKDNGKHWRICRKTRSIWISYKKSIYGPDKATDFDSELLAQERLDSFARAYKWVSVGKEREE